MKDVICPYCRRVFDVDETKPVEDLDSKKWPDDDTEDDTVLQRQANEAFMTPVYYDSVLEQVIGKGPLSRVEISKRLWDHIKKHGLQEQTNKRMINCDTLLRPILRNHKFLCLK